MFRTHLQRTGLKGRVAAAHALDGVRALGFEIVSLDLEAFPMRLPGGRPRGTTKIPSAAIAFRDELCRGLRARVLEDHRSLDLQLTVMERRELDRLATIARITPSSGADRVTAKRFGLNRHTLRRV